MLTKFLQLLKAVMCENAEVKNGIVECDRIQADIKAILSKV